MPESDPPRRRRPVVLTVVAVLLVLGAVKALLTLLVDLEQFRAAFPGSTLALEVAAAILLCLLCSAVALLAWQRWAVVALVVAGVVTLVLDFVARAPWLHTAAGTVLIALLVLAVWPVRRHFAPWRQGAPHNAG